MGCSNLKLIESLMPCLSMGPKWFWTVQIVFVGSNLFWSGPNHFGQVQIINISPEKSNLNQTKMILSQPKQFGPNQNNLDSPKSFWTHRRTMQDWIFRQGTSVNSTPMHFAAMTHRRIMAHISARKAPHSGKIIGYCLQIFII